MLAIKSNAISITITTLPIEAILYSFALYLFSGFWTNNKTIHNN